MTAHQLTQYEKGQAILLRLYVVAGAPSSVRAIAHLEAVWRRYRESGYELDIVDILKEPTRALTDGVLVIPCLIKLYPPPVAMVIGDLSEEERLLPLFEVEERAAQSK